MITEINYTAIRMLVKMFKIKVLLNQITFSIISTDMI